MVANGGHVQVLETLRILPALLKRHSEARKYQGNVSHKRRMEFAVQRDIFIVDDILDRSTRTEFPQYQQLVLCKDM